MSLVRLEEVAAIVSGNSIPAKDRKGKFSAAQVSGRPFISTKDVGFDGAVQIETDVAIPEPFASDFKLAPAYSTLVCSEGGSAGRKIGWLEADAHFGNKLFCVTAKRTADPKFLHYFHLTDEFAFQFRERMTGLIGGVSLKKFKSIVLSLPPLEEQKRIVAVLDQAFAALDQARLLAQQNLGDVEALWEQLQCLFAKGHFVDFEPSPNDDLADLLVRVDETQSAGRKRKSYSLPEGFMPPFHLPHGWDWVPLGNLCTGITDGVHKTPSYVSEGIPFITVKNLTAGEGISFEGTKFIKEDDHAEYIKRTHPEKDDILISKDGTIGVVRRIETDRVFSIFVSVALVKPALREMSAFLSAILATPDVQRAIVPKGAALKHLYLADLRQLPVPIGPLSQQKMAIDRLSKLARLIDDLRRKRAQCVSEIEALRSSILEKAFAGELT